MPPISPYTRTSFFVSQPVVSVLPLANGSRAANLSSSSLSSIISCLTLMLALIYCATLFCAYRYAQLHPRPLNKTSGLRLQRYAPCVYVFMVLGSLAELALSSWLLLQYKYHQNYPNFETFNAIKILLFSASWTTMTAGAYTLLFLHPTWSRHSISSVGAQVIWVFLTWIFWVIGAGMMHTALPSLLVKGSCSGLVYCSQLQTTYAFSVMEIIALTGGMVTMMWLAWQSTRNIVHHEPPSLAPTP